MAGRKRKLSAGSTETSSPNGPARRAQNANCGDPREDSNSGGNGVLVNDSRSSPPESRESSHKPKRTRRPRGSSAEITAGFTSPRSTRQSARILSKELGNDSSPDSKRGHESEPGHVNGRLAEASPPVSSPPSRSESFRSTATDPTAPENTSQDTPSKTNHQNLKGKVEGDCPSPTDTNVVEDVNDGNSDVEMSNTIDDSQQLKHEDLEVDIEPDNSRSSTHNTELERATDSMTPLPIPALTVSGIAPVPQSEPNSALGRETPTSVLSASPALTASDVGESSAPPSRRGGFRGRANGGRRNARGRGRGGRGGKQNATGRLQPITPSLPPSPAPLSKQLRERQKELERAYRKVAAAQKIALGVIATRTMTRLVKDPKAHMDTPHYREVEDELDKALQRRLDQIEHEHAMKVQTADDKKDYQQYVLNTNLKNKIREIRDEHFTAAQGSFMDFIQKSRQAEDDDHTEPDESDSEAGVLRRNFVRGFDSSYVRDPEGAADYDRANFGWAEFFRRAKILDDISPQIKEINEESGQSGVELKEFDRVSELVDALMKASKDTSHETGEIAKLAVTPLNDKERLSRFADIALETRPGLVVHIDHGSPRAAPPAKAPEGVQRPYYSEQFPPASYSPARSQAAPSMAEQEHPRLLPHYPPPLPTMAPLSQQQPMHTGVVHGGMPRPLLPAPGLPPPTIPPLSDHLRLPDPFSSNAQVLPVPPGAAYHLPPPHLGHTPPGYPPYHAPMPPRFVQGPPGPPPPYYHYGMHHPPPPHGYGYGYGPHPRPHPHPAPPPPPHHQQHQYPPHHTPPARHMHPY